MKCTITGKNLKLTDGIKSAINNKLSKLNKYFSSEPKANVICSTDAGNQKIEATIVYQNKIIRSEVVSNDLYVSIDTAAEVLERKIRKYKTKLSKDLKEDSIRLLDIEDDIEEAPVRICRTKHYDLKPMYPEDACLESELVGHNFYLFVNAENYQVCAVYKRNNGTYGLIVPEE